MTAFMARFYEAVRNLVHRSEHSTPKMTVWEKDVFESIEQGQCVLCTVARHTADRYMEALFYEQVNDPHTRTLFRKAWGFCPNHTARVETVGDGLGASILYVDLLTMLVAVPSSMKPSECPACTVENDAVQRYVRLIDHMARQSPAPEVPLCWPHLKELVTNARGVSFETRQNLWAQHGIIWNGWIRSLREAAHSDYEASPSPEALGMWRQAARYFQGTIALPNRSHNPPTV